MNSNTDWLTTPKAIKGQDQLGSQAPCELAYSQLLPGITNVTDRARYFSFYSWVAWSLENRYKAADAERYTELYRRADCLYTLIAAREGSVAGKTRQAEAMIGRLRLVPALNSLLEGSSLRLSDYTGLEETKQRYFKNSMGGLGQYYIGPMTELGICTKTTKGPWITYDSKLGEALAKAVDSELPVKRFWDVVEANLVTDNDLQELRPFCPHLLPQYASEQSVLLDVFFARTPYMETRVNDGRALQRRRTLGLLLSLGSALSEAGLERLSEWTFRPAVYTGCLPGGENWLVPSPLVQTRLLWSIYERNDLLSTAFLLIFAASLTQIREEAARTGDIYDSVESFALSFCSHQDLIDSLQTLDGHTFGEMVENIASKGPQLWAWEDPRHEFSFEGRLLNEWGESDKRNPAYFITQALQLLALLAARDNDLPNGYGDLLIQESELQAYPINLVSFHTRVVEWTDWELQRVIANLVIWCLNAHLTVALRKLSQTGTNSFHLRAGENGLQVLGEIPPPTRTLPRIRQGIRILEDLGAFESTTDPEDSLKITSLGISLLEYVLA